MSLERANSKEEEATPEINKKLRDIKSRYFVDLLRLPGVVMVGLGSNYLRIYFDKTVDGAEVNSLPHSIESVPVRVIPYIVPNLESKK